jgi:PAS domain S-box-containing protein
MEEMSRQGRIGAWEVDLVNNKATWSEVTKEIHEVPVDYEPDLASAINFYKEGESRNTIISLVEKAINDGVPFETESELVTAKGNTIWVASHAKATFENGKCVKLYGSFQDISEKKKIAQEMIDKNRRMNLAADSSGIGIWEYNVITNELSWDDWMFRLYGVDKRVFSGAYEAWERGLHPEDAERSAHELQLAIEGKQKFDTQFRVIQPNGNIRYLKAAAIVIKDKVGNPHTMVGVNYDITDRVETEIALTKAKELAEQASKAKNEFLASMSHEIRTPMNGVVGMLDLLADSPLDQSQKHQVSVAKSSADSLLFLINDILDFSKIDANKLELEKINFDINTLLSESADALMQQAEHKGLELIVDSAAVVEPLIVGDPNRIRQIITNLVSNAIKFTQQGEVLIKLALIPDDAEHWRLRISVKDTGIGISKANQRHLFESFNQVDSSTTRKFGGTGLGLAIVKKLCQCMAGDVSLISDEGQGCLFICDVQVGKSSQVIPLMPSVVLKNLSVLVVDDNKTNREVVSKQLNTWQITATCVDSAEAALELCTERVASNKPLFDVAILDMQMPDMDGAQLAKTLRADKRFNSMKLVMMTSMNSQGDAKLFAGLGFSAYFPKPATSSDLFNALNIIVDNGLALSNADPLITKHYIKSLNKTIDKQDELIITWPDNSKVLLVEDNRVNQMVAKGVLDKIGMPCAIAVNGQDALDKLKQDSGFSLILMDCQMPVMDGYQASENIRSGQAGISNTHIPIVAMTANAMQGDREKCLAAGMNDYLTKPIDKDLVVEKLTYWLKQQ